MARKAKPKGYSVAMRGLGNFKGTVYLGAGEEIYYPPSWDYTDTNRKKNGFPDCYDMEACYAGWLRAGGPKMKPGQRLNVTIVPK